MKIIKILIFVTLYFSCAYSHKFNFLNQKFPKTPIHETPDRYNYTIGYYENMPVDHFTYTNADTFKIRFFYNLDYYKPGGPIFFFPGVRGDRFEAYGLIWDIAPLFNAAIILAEHRYYGESMPYGNHSTDDVSKIGYLDTSQVLADCAILVPYVKENIVKNSSKVIAIGSSYGGMIATWFRMKYPTVVDGAWSSSSPLLLFPYSDTGVSLYDFDKVATRTLVESGCSFDGIIETFKAIDRLSKSSEGLKNLNQIFKIDSSSPLTSYDDVQNYLKPYIRNAFEAMVQTDYPYNFSFFGPLPAWPVSKSCQFLSKNGSNNDTQMALNMYNAISIFYGDGVNCVITDKCGFPDSEVDFIFEWQDCTEMIQLICAKGPPNDIFWNDCNETTALQNQLTFCSNYLKKLGYTSNLLRLNAIKQEYGFAFGSTSNIIFTVGSLNTYSSGAVTLNTSGIANRQKDGVYYFYINGSAMSLDLMPPNTCDPETVVNARFQIVQILNCWVNDVCLYEQEDLPRFNFTDLSLKAAKLCLFVCLSVCPGRNLDFTTRNRRKLELKLLIARKHDCKRN